jgi:hypothetical protein
MMGYSLVTTTPDPSGELKDFIFVMRVQSSDEAMNTLMSRLNPKNLSDNASHCWFHNTPQQIKKILDDLKTD